MKNSRPTSNYVRDLMQANTVSTNGRDFADKLAIRLIDKEDAEAVEAIRRLLELRLSDRDFLETTGVPRDSLSDVLAILTKFKSVPSWLHNLTLP